MIDTEDVGQPILMGLTVAIFLLNTARALKAIELCKDCLNFLNNKALGKEKQFCKIGYAAIYKTMFEAHCLLPDYTNAIKYGRKLLVIYHEYGDTSEEGKFTIILADIYKQQYKYEEAGELYERAINIMKEIGDREGQAAAYERLGRMSYCLSKYIKAKEYFEKGLAIDIETGDKAGEAASYGNLAAVFVSLGEYEKANEHLIKALHISIEIGDKAGEASSYENLGTVFYSLCECDKAKEYLDKALAIHIEIGNRAGEATSCGSLGTVFQSLGEYDKAREYRLVINIESGDKAGEAASYENLGTVFQSLGEYDKAKEYPEKALAIKIEVGDRAGEGNSFGNLGTVFQNLGEYDKAKKYLEKALAIKIEVGDRAGEAASYGKLGTVFQSLGEYEKAKEYHDRALSINIEIGHKRGKAISYENLGTVSESLGDYEKAKEYLDKALIIKIEIGDKEGVATSYGNLGTVFKSLGEYDKAKEYLDKALANKIESGDRSGEAACYGHLGSVFQSLGEYVMAEGYLKKALSINQDIGDLRKEIMCYCELTVINLLQVNMQEACHYLLLSIKKSEDFRQFLKENDQFKISFSDVFEFPYRLLSTFFCVSGNPNNALYVSELLRARALADSVASHYSVKTKISVNPQSWIGIESIMKKVSNCTCLYVFYYGQDMFLWILKTSGVIHFRRITVNENVLGSGLTASLDDFFAKSFRSFGILPEEGCEDRSLCEIQLKLKSNQEEMHEALRLVKYDEEIQNPEPELSLCYRLLIGLVADLLEKPEIIIVPDAPLYQVPFAALTDGCGKFLSETYRIRLVPSLTTLKLIQDSPADYHSQTGALIVGDPLVGRVRYKGRRKNFLPLPCARKEAEMIGKLLDVQPLLGQDATKKAVLQAINSVSLIHFAAHGNAERGEIALSPVRTTSKIPREEDYLLTMSDISSVRLRAKLVVLSCCHSGCGQIRAEGVIGIARAFLGSGARSVLVALWAIEDKATEQFMNRFYEHLVCGESVSESLHETMKWMRDNGFTKVSEWAPFMLIGDNVTLDFRN